MSFILLKLQKIKHYSRQNLQKGFTLSSLMTGLAVGSFSMVVLGFSMKITNDSMDKIHVHNSLMSISQDLRHYILDDPAWGHTVRDLDNVSMQCLRTGDDCTSQITPSPFKINTTQNTLYYNSLLPNSGFTSKGVNCDTYQNTGNSDCPIRVDLSWNAVCAALDCVNPDVLISVTFTYNPTPGHQINTLVNTSIYNFVFIRKDRSLHDELFAVYTHPAGLQTGEAVCTPGDWKTRMLNTIIFDKGKNISLINNTVTNTQFRLESGTYECRIQAQAYDTGESKVRLYNVSSGAVVAESSSYFTGEESAVDLELSLNLSFENPTVFEIQQYCEKVGGTPANMHDFGVPTMVPNAYYSAPQSQIFSALECTRIK